MHFYDLNSVRRGAHGASVTVAFPGGARVSVEVTDEVASALRDMQREIWRIERREARHTLSLDAMGTFVASTGPESEPGFDLLSKCRTGELVAALVQLPAVQLRRLLMHAVAQLPVKEIARREGCSERAVKYSLAKARKRMRELLACRVGIGNLAVMGA